jgi:3-deoxy-D-manno-octulosonate 8-phosphate phosphatase (KDO 8-P phosphatase)
MGVERLREAGIETAILTRERSPIVARRVEKLCLRHHFEGVADKRACLPRIVAETGAAAHEIAFIGDDLNDVELLLEVAKGGLTGAPADAMPRVAQLAHHQGRAAGGAGAFREFAEWILRLRGAERPDGRGEAA